jgi:hypothetical protein
MKALGLPIPKVTLESEIGSLDQKLWSLEDFRLHFHSALAQNPPDGQR